MIEEERVVALVIMVVFSGMVVEMDGGCNRGGWW